MTTTTNKGLTDPAYGDLNWNVPLNANFDIIDKALGSAVDISVTGLTGTQTLTATQYQNLILNFTGTLTANLIYQVPSGVGGQWIISNNTTGAYTITFRTGAAGTSVLVPNFKTGITVYSNGTDVYQGGNSNFVTVQDFGAVGDGVTNDTAAIQTAISAANSSGFSLYFPDGTYMANSLDFTVGFTMAPGAKLKFNGSANGYLADLTANDKRVGYASFDGATSNCTLFKINGDRNFVGSVYIANSTASVSGTSSLYGVAVLGDYNIIENISAYKLENTGFSNESFPQAVFVSGGENTIQNVYGDDCQSLVVTGATSDNTSIGSIVSRNSNDNGVYWLGGDLLINSLDYYGFNEPLVCVGASPAKLKVGSLNNYGTGIIGLDNATGDVEIDNIFISTLTGSIIRTRSGNTASGSVKIQKITGTFTGTSLWDLSTGTVEYFSVSEMNVTFNYDAAVSGPITSWALYSGCKGFNFGSLKINIVDVNNVLTGSDYFSLVAPTTNLTYRSFVDRVDITIVNSNGFTQSAAAARGFNLFASNLVQVENARVQVNVGPYLREVSDATSANGIVIIGAAAPTIGTWRRGQVVWYSDASAGAAPGAVCVTAGTPGTWKNMAALSA